MYTKFGSLSVLIPAEFKGPFRERVNSGDLMSFRQSLM